MEERQISASEELESLAVKYAHEAIELERKGSKRIAGTKYQRAIEVLLKLCSLYPNAPQNKVYLEHAEAYRKRVQELQSDSEPIAHPSDSTETKDSKNIKFDQWVLTEKPNISWDDIAGLEKPKRAIEESVVFPVRRPISSRSDGLAESYSLVRQDVERPCSLPQWRVRSREFSFAQTQPP